MLLQPRRIIDLVFSQALPGHQRINIDTAEQENTTVQRRLLLVVGCGRQVAFERRHISVLPSGLVERKRFGKHPRGRGVFTEQESFAEGFKIGLRRGIAA